ncbi:MAG: hypothetical protein LBT99_00680, partial [Bifidobacteriaceae bacterium]|nr:hypothetical protein [Bifidobacteriaceae bacterium]
SQVNAASSSTVLPVAKGGTGSNSASGARTNLNAQEKLVSGTNIKSVFNNSLLGSGNINNYTTSTTIQPGQKYQTGIAGSTVITVNNISFQYNNQTIKWNQRIWAESIFYHTPLWGENKTTGFQTTDTTKNMSYTIPQSNSVTNAWIFSTSGNFIVNISLNGYSGMSIVMERYT